METPPKLAHKFKSFFKAKRLSFSFIFSILIYISTFYIFTLSSPYNSAVFSNTNFWFVVANAFILIIAADYVAFSSSNKDKKRDLHKEYAFFFQYPKIVNLKEEESLELELGEQILEDVGTDDRKNNKILLEVVEIEGPDETDHHTKMKMEPKPMIKRSKSDEVKRVTYYYNDDMKKNNNLQRSKTEKHEQPVAKENDEFSTMSDKELNRRVEEFIRKFNRQIVSECE